MSFKWSRCLHYNEMKELFEKVIPDEDCWDKENMLTKHPEWVRGYVATFGNETKVVAISVVGWLPETKTLHIDCFAIDESVRGKGLSYCAWSTFLDFVQKEWIVLTSDNEWNGVSVDNLLIEVYLKNVKAWNKIMKVEPTGIDRYVKKNKVKNDVLIMGKNMDFDKAINAYKEWQYIENNWNIINSHL